MSVPCLVLRLKSAQLERSVVIQMTVSRGNFANNPTCRLINPSKTELGRISKRILEVINSKLVRATKVNQWKNTSSVLQWYK